MASTQIETARAQGLAAAQSLQGDNPGTSSNGQMWRDHAHEMAQLLGWPTEKLVSQVVAFHRERLDAVPDLTRYPELRGYRDRLQAQEDGMRAGGVSDEMIALSKSFNFWRDTRLVEESGYVWSVSAIPHAATTEKCRVLYMADSDRGALRLKNVDDPLTYWQTQPPIRHCSPWPEKHPLSFDGVGSGLFLDEAPQEIFPVNAHELCREHCTTLDEATEFMVRYNYFWEGQNLIIHDENGNSMAFEKTRCRVAVRKPNAQGINFITGMGALDPEIAAFQKSCRQRYLDQTGQGWDDSPEGLFFTLSENTWKNMARYVDELSLSPTWNNAQQLMEQRDRSGPMCLTGEKLHPDETVTGCTLIMNYLELDNRKLHRRQWRGDIPAYLDTPEVVQFA